LAIGKITVAINQKRNRMSYTGEQFWPHNENPYLRVANILKEEAAHL